LKDETAYLGLGSNMGDRQKHIMDMVDMLKNTPGITLNAVSPIYETKPVGYADQDDFLNGAVEITTIMDPFQLLDVCMRIENALERRRTVKWGPRTADMDILFYGELVMATEKLTIPHPLLHERGFVLLPLMDIAPDKVHPARKVSIRDLCKNAGCSGITLYRPGA
jgi:dihydroneopterin aldolase/2-amino-4-hydroxy-6-hydroxymethyldihydropteridine diphosphokinase